MLRKVLANLGFEEIDIEIYLILLQRGAMRVSDVAKELKVPRTTMQNLLSALEWDGFINKTQEKNYFLYAAAHPDNLPKLVELRKQEQMTKYNQSIDELTKFTPQLVSMMKGNYHLPNVSLYRGREAARTVLFDTLTSKTELHDYVNADAVFSYIKDINDEYVSQREKTKIRKRSLILDTPLARKLHETGIYSPRSHVGWKWINCELYPFSVEMNIYDGKVSYLTYVEDNFVGIIIQNPQIYQLHNSMWNLAWNLLPDPITPAHDTDDHSSQLES